MAHDFGKKPYAYPSNEFRPKLNSDGSWTATDSFICPWSTVQSLLPSIGGNNPRPGWTFLLAESLEIEPNRADLCKVIVSYTSKSTGEGDFDFDSADKDDFTYSLQITTNTEDIETNYRYKDVSLYDKETISYVKLGSYIRQAKDSYVFVDTARENPRDEITDLYARELVDFILKGVTSYDLQIQVWSASWTANERPQDYLFERVGTITDPPGDPPVIAGRDWLMSGLDMEQTGKTYKITARYSMSGRGGWIPQLYDPDAEPPTATP
jgi:hypothetical protein